MKWHIGSPFPALQIEYSVRDNVHDEVGWVAQVVLQEGIVGQVEYALRR
jgi:hypothetical protein